MSPDHGILQGHLPCGVAVSRAERGGSVSLCLGTGLQPAAVGSCQEAPMGPHQASLILPLIVSYNPVLFLGPEIDLPRLCVTGGNMSSHVLLVNAHC